MTTAATSSRNAESAIFASWPWRRSSCSSRSSSESSRPSPVPAKRRRKGFRLGLSAKCRARRQHHAGCLTGPSVSYSLPLVVTYEVGPWEALGDATRRAIFERLVERPRAVGELASDFPVSRPAVSQHLRVLKEAGLVSDHPEGTRRVYVVNPSGLATLRADLDRFWTHALTAFKTAVERPSRGQRNPPKEKMKP
jgi:DNA-binding transcriptional ArsR family regulator